MIVSTTPHRETIELNESLHLFVSRVGVLGGQLHGRSGGRLPGLCDRRLFRRGTRQARIPFDGSFEG